MGKFVRQAVVTWPQFRTNIKNKSHIFEGKEYIGWDLPMNEQIRLFRIQEARITEVANFTNFNSDANSVSTYTSAGKKLYKKGHTAQVTTFKFASLVSSGSISGSFGSGSGENYFDVFTGHTDRGGKPSTGTGPALAGLGNTGCRFAIFSSSIAADLPVLEAAATTLPNGFMLVTASYEGGGGLNVAADSVYHIMNSFTASIANTIAGASVLGKTQPYTPSDFFALSISSGSAGDKDITLTITNKHAGSAFNPTTTIPVGTGSVATLTEGHDVLAGPDGATWSSTKITDPNAFGTYTRIV
jgi:hypothetical protein